MKTFLFWALILWFALVVENSKPDMFPSCSLILPLAVGCIFWLQNGMSILLTGTALLARWLLHPSSVPIEVVVTLIGSAAFFAPTRDKRRPLPATTGSDHHLHWLAPVVVTVIALSAHAFAMADMRPNMTLSMLWVRIIIAGPSLVIIALARKAASEFGFMRHSVQV